MIFFLVYKLHLQVDKKKKKNKLHLQYTHIFYEMLHYLSSGKKWLFTHILVNAKQNSIIAQRER